MHIEHAPVATTASGDLIAVRAPARERWSWALYDFANTIFSMNVASLFFSAWVVADLGVSNTAVALAIGISSALVAVSIPIFGAISDARQRRKPWVVTFTLLAVSATFFIGVVGYAMAPMIGEGLIGGGAAKSVAVPASAVMMILLAFVAANYFYQGALPFYNAMLPELAPPTEWGRLSGFGAAIGYVGSIVGVILVTPFFSGAFPIFGEAPRAMMDTLRAILPFTDRAGRVSTFVPTAVLFLLFSIPLFVFCRDHRARAERVPIRWREALRDVVAAVRETRKYPGALRFIIAAFLYQDAMGTIIGFMALYAVEAAGFERGAEVTMFVVLTVPAVLGGYFWGRLIDRIGPKRTLTIILMSWVVLLTALILAPSQAAFWVVGAMIGLIYGGVATTERPMLLTLVPDVEAGRFFGLMVLSARAAAIAGPLIWGLVVDSLRDPLGAPLAYRFAVGTVILAMIAALLVLRGVPDRSKELKLRTAN